MIELVLEKKAPYMGISGSLFEHVYLSTLLLKLEN